jgi:LysR family transcriptional regulator (chromosome initiation inhibitor)
MIELRELAALRAVVTEGSFDAAATQLNVTPGAVSQRIRALEDRVGRPVVVRSSPVRLTEAGQVVSRLAQQIQLLQDEAAELLIDEARREARVVSVAVNYDSLATWFLGAMAEFAKKSTAQLDLHAMDRDHTLRSLRDGTVVAAVTSERAAVPGCTVRPIGALNYIAVASRSFAKEWFGSGFNPRSLDVAPMLRADRNDFIGSKLVRSASRKPISCPVHFIPSGTHDLVRAALLGLGWCMLPTGVVKEHVSAGNLICLSSAVLDVPLYWQVWKVDSPLLSTLSDAVLAAARISLENTGSNV